MAVIIIAGIALFVLIRKRFRELDGFEGIVTQKGPRREPHDWCNEDPKNNRRSGKKTAS